MKSTKVSLAKAKNEYVYSDVYGFVNSKVAFSIVIKYIGKDYYGRNIEIEKELFLNDNDIYFKNGGMSFVHLTNKELANIFKLDLYTLKSRVDINAYYRYSSTPTEQDVVKLVSVRKVILRWQNEIVEGSPNNKKAITDFLESKVYEYSSEFNKSESLFDYEIKENQLVRLQSGGTYKVIELYSQPNKDNMLCKICSLGSDKTIDIPCSTYSTGKQQRTRTTLYKVPYEEYPERIDELGVFNSELCELKLNPFWEQCQAGNHKGSLYWQAIEEAASYKVSLYKYRFEEFVEKKLYLLEEFEIDRNKHWLTIDNLYGDNYIVRITAENRSGMPIAASRGIPVKFAGKENKVQYWM